MAGVIALTLVLVSAALAAPSAPAPSAKVINTDSQGVNLRRGPGVGYGVLRTIPAGAAVSIRGDAAYADGYWWYPVQYRGLNGYAAGQYLSVGDVKNRVPPISRAPAASANYDAAHRPDDFAIKAVVIHVAQGPYRAVISASQDPEHGVSAHYVVGPDGAITQLVSERNVAYHAGNRWYNQHSIGIEHAGFIDQPGDFTPAMYRASAALVRQICARYGVPRDRQHILGHREVPGATHRDPGPYWDWDLYLRLIRDG